MTVLLFGASGFIGRAVRRALSAYSTVVCPSRTDCDLVDGDVDEVVAVLRREKPDAVVNCTGRLAGTGYQLVRAQTDVTAKLIEAIALAAPGARLVRLGSAAEYGRVPRGHAVNEEDAAAPVSEYGVSHLAGTRLVELACAAGQLDGAVLRVFNPVGPGLPEENVLGRVAALLRDGKEEIETGPLDAYRDFVDVRDVAHAVRATLTATELPHRVFNVGSGRAVSTRDAVRQLIRTAGGRGEVREAAPAPHRSAAVDWMCADIGRATAVLGWQPQYELAESVTALWHGASDD